MLSIWPITWIVLPGLSCFCRSATILLIWLGDAAEIAALNAGIDLVDRLDVGLVGVGRHAVALERRDVAEQARHRDVGSAVVESAVETGVLPRSLSELILCSGVCTAR